MSEEPYIIPQPKVIVTTPNGETGFDPYSRLLSERIVFLGTPINDSVANLIIAQILHLEAEDPEKDIILYINSPGGSITSALAIYDTMQYVKCDIQTNCIGQAASAGAFLLATGTSGKRFSLPNSRILIHQPSGGAGGQAIDIDIQAKEILRLRKLLEEIMSKHTGQPIERIQKDTDRDYFMTAHQAKEYGIIDEVVDKRKKVK